MNIVLWAQESPVTNQAEHLWSWTYLYWIPLPIIIVVGLWKAAQERRTHGPAKLREQVRYTSFDLETQRQKLISYREWVEKYGTSPVGGKSPEQAIADQEAVVRGLYQLQSDLKAQLPSGEQRARRGR